MATDIFKGVIAYIDRDALPAASSLEAILMQHGARVLRRLTQSVTHFITAKSAEKSAAHERAVDLLSQGKLKMVDASFVDASVKAGNQVAVDAFLIDGPAASVDAPTNVPAAVRAPRASKRKAVFRYDDDEESEEEEEELRPIVKKSVAKRPVKQKKEIAAVPDSEPPRMVKSIRKGLAVRVGIF